MGTTAELASRYPFYEVHLSCRTREELLRAQQLMARVPGARQADDIATRWEVADGETISRPPFKIKDGLDQPTHLAKMTIKG